MLDPPLFHQSICVLHDLLVNVFPSGLRENFEAGLGEFLEEDFIDESEDVFGGPFDFDARVDSLHGFLEKVIVFGIAEDLVGVVVVSECFLELFGLLLRYPHTLHLLTAPVGIDVLLGGCLQVLHSIVVVHRLEDQVFGGLSSRLVIIVGCHEVKVLRSLIISQL